MGLDIALLRGSFEAVKPVAGEAAEFFYETLWNDFPGVRPLFATTPMDGQKKALIESLGRIVDWVDQPERLVPYLKKMGSRHVGYGAKPEHYPAVAQTVLKTFRHFFAENWTPDLEKTWSDALQVVAAVMLEGANEHVQASVQVPESARKVAVPADSTLQTEIRNLARRILEEAVQRELSETLERELKEQLQRSMREKARELLREALVEEAKAFLQQAG